MNRVPNTILAVVLAVLRVGVSARSVEAQGTGRAMDIDPSTRSAAMGTASNALFWGNELDHWANPALLGYVRGLGFEYNRIQLVPGLADDVILTSNVLKLGGGGVGVVLSGKPFGIGGIKLDYGQSQGTDETGNPTGPFNSFEDVDSWGFGANGIELIETLMRALGAREPGASRFVDVSFGMNFKHIDIQLAPSAFGGTGETDAHDWGFLVRVTPLDLGRSGVGPRARLDLAYGKSELSPDKDAIVTFLNEDQASPVTHHERDGYAARLALSPEVWPPAGWRSRGWRTFLDGTSPMFSLGVTYDRADIGTVTRGKMLETTARGLEIDFASVLAFRTGHYRDEVGRIDGGTWGWSASLPVAGVMRLRYEEARVPQAESSGLKDQVRRAFSIWLDPASSWEALRRR